MVTQTQTQTQQELYTHSAEPKPVQQRKAKYREDEQTGLATNIMFDRRVVRGNTYAARILPVDPPFPEKRTQGTLKKTGQKTQQRPPRTPEAVEGRRHADVQTDVYLEELTDTVPEVDTTTQTDAFLDRPPTPTFVPPRSGVDASTQILNGDLFDFDFEVEPILEVLVGKVLEQSLMEVMEEEELAAMRRHQEQFEQARNAELVVTQRMEAAERRKAEEKARRVAEERERKERERVVRQKVAAGTFARGYLNGIVNSVFSQLEETGFFYDPVQRQVEQEFMPWLQQQAQNYLSTSAVARQVVQQLVAEATAQLAARQQEREEAVAAQYAAAEAFAAQEALAAAEASARELEAVRQRATLVLRGLRPALVTAEQIDEAAAALQTRAVAEADASWEAAKARAAEEKRAELAELAAAAAAAHAEAVAQAEANGEEAPAAPEAATEAAEAAVQAASDAVSKPAVEEVTDGDILSALIEKGTLSKDAIIQALALAQLGDQAYYNHPDLADA